MGDNDAFLSHNQRPVTSSTSSRDTGLDGPRCTNLDENPNQSGLKPRPIPKVKSLSETVATPRTLPRQSSANQPRLIHESSSMSLSSKEDIITVKYLPMSNDSLNQNSIRQENTQHADAAKLFKSDIDITEAQIISWEDDPEVMMQPEKSENVSKQ